VLNWGRALPSTTTPGGRSDFLQQLLAIQQDPEVKNLAWRRARDLDVAEDALQETYYAIARLKNPERIRDLRAYFCKVLIREIYHLLGQLGATLVDDFIGLTDARQGKASDGPPPPQPFDEMVGRHLLARGWLRNFATQRADLARKVPGRSPDPVRYRDAIVTVAEWVLRSVGTGNISDADRNRALRAAYPEWFTTDGCEAGNVYQRFSRARADVNGLLRTVISRDDLYS
jgi:DNA-directed RNA polymerase specialized sigma24 family protein